MTRQELYEYLNKNESTYYIVKYNNRYIEPLYFFPYNDVWFESPCFISKSKMTEDDLWEYTKEVAYEPYWNEQFEEYKKNLIEDYWYEVDNPQCSPFITTVETIKPITEKDIIKAHIEIVEKENYKNYEEYFANEIHG